MSDEEKGTGPLQIEGKPGALHSWEHCGWLGNGWAIDVFASRQRKDGALSVTIRRWGRLFAEFTTKRLAPKIVDAQTYSLRVQTRPSIVAIDVPAAAWDAFAAECHKKQAEAVGTEEAPAAIAHETDGGSDVVTG